MNVYAYRLPGEHETICRVCSELSEFPHAECFAVSQFSLDSKPVYFIAKKSIDIEDVDNLITVNEDDSDFPQTSTTEHEHRVEVESIIELIKAGKLEKCVAASWIVVDANLKVSRLWRKLEEFYPQAFLFLFSSPKTGTWIGASPELLLERCCNNAYTMALAGTRPVNTNEEWSAKNIDEQQIVVDYIKDTVKQMGLKPVVGERHTKVAGPVEHICVDIHINNIDLEVSRQLAVELSPTAALCGLPKVSAASVIAELERTPRKYYGGYCGPVYPDGNFRYYVNLRSMRIIHDRVAIPVGGGIVLDSNPHDEWIETRRKAETMLRPLMASKECN